MIDRFTRRDVIKLGAAGAAGIAASGLLVGTPNAAAATMSFPPEKGASLRVLRWKRFVAGDEKQWMENTRKFTKATGVPVRVDNESWEDVRESVDAMHVQATAQGAPLVVVAVPWEPQLDADRLKRDRALTLKPQAKLQAICDDAGLPLLDLHPLLVARSDLDLYEDGIHFRRSGHELVARTLEDWLFREGLLPVR